MTLFAAEQLELVEKASSRELEERLSGGRASGIAFIACSEMGAGAPGIPTDPGLPIYVWQNLGGCIDDELALEDLVRANQISDLVIYGHYPCALLSMALSDQKAPEYSSVSSRYLAGATAELRQYINDECCAKQNGNAMKKVAEHHVLRQLIKAMHLLPIAKARSGNDLRLHGWIWNSESSQVHFFDPAKGIFVPSAKD